MKKYQLAGAVSLVALAVSASPTFAKSDSIAAAIKADEAALVKDFNACDAVKAASYDAPDVVAMAHGVPNMVGAAADMAQAKKGCMDKTQHVTVANESVDVGGDIAVYHSTYVFTGTDAKTKKPMTENGNYLAGWKKQSDGSWKMEWSIVSNTP
jgi:ketosteroid isomerase-like protein